MDAFRFLELAVDLPGVARIWLNRPTVCNALHPALLAEVEICFTRLAEAALRVVVLGGRGDYFSAGADILWLQQTATLDLEERLAAADAFSRAQLSIAHCPCPVIARVQGGAFGQALGLLSCCDQVIAADNCSFGFSEVRLGVTPALILPQLATRINLLQAQDVILSGARFDAAHAVRLGLVNYSVVPHDLDDVIDGAINEFLEAEPGAVAATKQFLRSLAGPLAEMQQQAAHLTARLRGSPEASEGLAAFIAGRRPAWHPEAAEA